MEKEQQILARICEKRSQLSIQLIDNHEHLLDAFSKSDDSVSRVSILEKPSMKNLENEERVILETFQNQWSRSDI